MVYPVTPCELNKLIYLVLKNYNNTYNYITLFMLKVH